MYHFSNIQKTELQNWFEYLRDQICATFEQLEDELSNSCEAPGRFVRTPWTRKEENGGGGVMSVMKGRVFEKVGVNVSTVMGSLTPQFAKQIPGASDDLTFWASGISLVAHMRSPHVPAVHMNTRAICTSQSWFGGGADLTPIFENAQDTTDFHAALKQACDRHNPTYYPQFKAECDQYFYLPHREEARGVGGIFYDYLNTGSYEKDFAYTQDIGKTFHHIYPQIVRRHMHKPWTPEEREAQLYKRGRYVEFNLLYDRGTTFGLRTGGYTEAILMSLPPEVKWR